MVYCHIDISLTTMVRIIRFTCTGFIAHSVAQVGLLYAPNSPLRLTQWVLASVLAFLATEIEKFITGLGQCRL